MGKNTERTGTLPFMALDLLTEKGLKGHIRHTYEHDAEAFFWVAVVDDTIYPQTEELQHEPNYQKILSWLTRSLSPISLAESKSHWLMNPDTHCVTEKQKIGWDGGFSKLPRIWFIQQSSQKYQTGPSLSATEQYKEYLRIRDEHERVHPELKRNGPISE